MSYDEIPYESTPFVEADPGRLAVHARLFGVAAADPRECRVLEIGCASGGNLIPLAFYLPHSRFLGIDLSGAQIAAGRRLVEKLGLDNIELRQADVAEFDAGEGPFDYILVHGVYSWAPPAVRERILALCGAALAEHGILYLSYNTLPGWHTRGMLREMLLRHTRGEASARARLEAAKEFLAELHTGLGGFEGAHAAFLGAEIERIASRPPSYLFHEYLEDHNEAFLFSDVAAACARHGLAFVCEAHIDSMLPEALPDSAGALLAGIDDPIEIGQRIDYLVGRNFRQSLFTRGAAPTLHPDAERLTECALRSDLTPPKKIDLHRVKAAPFHDGAGGSWAVHHPLTKAALAHLHEIYPAALPFAELAAAAERQVYGVGERFLAGQSDELRNELFSLYVHSAVGAVPRADAVPARPGPRPRASALAHAQAELGLGHAAGRHQATVLLDEFARAVLTALDGSSDRAALVERLMAEIETRAELRALIGELPEPTRLRRMVEANLDRLLAAFTRQGLLEAAQ